MCEQVDNKEVFTFSDTVLHAYHWTDNKWRETDKQLVPNSYFEYCIVLYCI